MTTLGISIAALSVTKAAAKTACGDLYQHIKKERAIKMATQDIETLSKYAVKKVEHVRKVKTLWQTNKAIDLKTFYCHPHVTVDKKRKHVRTIDEFGDSNTILIQGIAGQGKSIFLRYLYSTTMMATRTFPIFIELRRITDVETLFHNISKSLGLSEHPYKSQITTKLLEAGKLSLFLDGFDEVSEPYRQTLIREITDLIDLYPDVSIILSSRPNTGIEMCNPLKVCKLSNLENDEYKDVILKISHEKGYAEKLIDKIETEKTYVKSILITPLLVSQLVMIYKSYCQRSVKMHHPRSNQNAPP
jgi:predicted NACHT family NTPase